MSRVEKGKRSYMYKLPRGQSGVSMVRDLWWERFTEKVSFEFLE